MNRHVFHPPGSKMRRASESSHSSSDYRVESLLYLRPRLIIIYIWAVICLIRYSDSIRSDTAVIISAFLLPVLCLHLYHQIAGQALVAVVHLVISLIFRSKHLFLQ